MLHIGRQRTRWMIVRNTKSGTKLRSMMDYEVNYIKDSIEFDVSKCFIDDLTHEVLAVYMTKPMEYYENRKLLHTDFIIKVDLFVKDSEVFTKFCVPGPEYDIKLRNSVDPQYKEITYKGSKILKIEIRKDV